MSVATRALFTGASAPGPRGAVIALTSVPDGGWTQVIEPRAIEYDGILYFGFVDGDDGHVKVGKLDGVTVTLATVGTAPEVDTHDAPVLHRRASDGRLMVWWSGHDGAAMNQRITTNVLPDISSWGSTTNLDSQLGGTAYTYPSVVALGTDLYLFFRDRVSNDGKVAYSKSTDGGATWSTRTVVATADPVPGRVYFVVGSDGSRIDVALSPDHPTVSDVGVHHLWFDGTTWRSAGGTSLGSPPFLSSSLPLVYDGSTDPAWASSILSDGPTLTYAVLDDPSSNAFWRARWNGSAWTHEHIADSGATVESGVATPCTLSDDPDVVYAPIFDGAWGIRRYRDGVGTPVTVGGADLYPARIHGGTVRKVAWLRGAYTSPTDTSLRVMAGR